MFLRFSKKVDLIQNRVKKYRKAVLLGDSLIMEYGNEIVGIAKLHEETDKCLDYDIVVAKDCELNPLQIARCIKDMIGRANKFSDNPNSKRRKYFVEQVSGTALPIKAQISFSPIK